MKSTILSNQDLGARLRSFRKGKKITQEQLAEALDVSSQLIQQYESGRSQMTSHRLQAIAQVLGISVGELFGEPPSILSKDEQKLIQAFRLLPNNEVKKFILNCLCK